MKTQKFVWAVALVAIIVSLFNLNLLAQTSGGGGGGGGTSGNFPDGCTSFEGYSTTTGLPCSCNPTAPAPDRLPIGTVGEIQAANWERVRNISLYSWAESVINDKKNDKSSVWLPYQPTNGVDPEEIFGIVRTQRLVLDVLYPSDTIHVGSSLYDINGNELFSSHSAAGINPPRGGVSYNVLDVVFEMTDDSWIPFANAQWFRIVERDSSGNPIRYFYSREWDVQKGMIRFPNYFSDKNGEVIVGLCDGTEAAYSLGNHGSRIIPTTVSATIGNVSALGMRTFQTNNMVFVEITKDEIDRHANPLIRLTTLKEKGTPHFFAAWRRNFETGEYEEIASAVHIWRKDSLPSRTDWKLTGPNYMYTDSTLRPMTDYWVEFQFASGWPYGKQFDPPYQYGGGKDVATPVTPTVVTPVTSP